jgi:2-polyprenyl-6-methoxyphenol hydroxylase-like FAD-dependent oxidoreductase
MDTREVVIIGGGIAGGALATHLAGAGLDVLVLEREARYEDRVRGEGMPPWGVVDAEQLGVADALIRAGGSYVAKVARYDEAVDASGVVPVDLTALGVRGFLHAGHPAMCDALGATASDAGADRAAPVEVTGVRPGAAPEVDYVDATGATRTVRARLVVAADGRASATRRRLGIELHKTDDLTFGGGMLVTGDRWPEDTLATGTERDLHFIITPRPGATRLYLFVTPEVARDRYTGSDKEAAFLDSYRLRSIPDEDAFLSARPAGPCAFFPMNDTWTDDPTAPGVVLIGDAAGWNNPIIGQGLGIAMRDARQVADVLGTESEWHHQAFRGYAEERRERMRRFRITAFVDTCLSTTFDDAATARRNQVEDAANEDPEIAALRFGRALGVDDMPESAYTEGTIRRVIGEDHPHVAALQTLGH